MTKCCFIVYIVSFFFRMNVKFLSDNAKLPCRGENGAAGYDLFCSEAIDIPARSRSLVKTGVALEIPSQFYGSIRSRSSLGVKGFDIGGGVIDSSYRGEIKVILINTTNDSKKIEVGDKIAQIVFERYYTFDMKEVDALSETERNDKGFGSTGI